MLICFKDILKRNGLHLSVLSHTVICQFRSSILTLRLDFCWVVCCSLKFSCHLLNISSFRELAFRESEVHLLCLVCEHAVGVLYLVQYVRLYFWEKAVFVERSMNRKIVQSFMYSIYKSLLWRTIKSWNWLSCFTFMDYRYKSVSFDFYWFWMCHVCFCSRCSASFHYVI